MGGRSSSRNGSTSSVRREPSDDPALIGAHVHRLGFDEEDLALKYFPGWSRKHWQRLRLVKRRVCSLPWSHSRCEKCQCFAMWEEEADPLNIGQHCTYGLAPRHRRG